MGSDQMGSLSDLGSLSFKGGPDTSFGFLGLIISYFGSIVDQVPIHGH